MSSDKFFRRPHPDYMVLWAVLIVSILWVIDWVFNVFLLDRIDPGREGMGSGFAGVAARLVFFCLFVIFAFYAGHRVNVRKRIEEALVLERESLKAQVQETVCRFEDVNAQLGREIKERKRMEAAVRESEEKYRLLVENAWEAIFIIQDNRIRLSNPKARQMMDRLNIDPDTPELSRFINPDERERVLEWYQRRLDKKEEAYSMAFELQGGSGFRRWVELNAILITLNGRPATLNFIRDVTVQKRLEQQFYQSQKMESIGTLAGGMAHDFNNLLMGIQGNVSVMMLDAVPEDPIHDSLESIERCVKSGSKLISQLLAFARGGKYLVIPTDLNTVVAKTADIFGRTRKEIHIHQTLAPDIGTVEVDPGQIEQVLLNLYVNAGQAMPGGGDLYLEVENVSVDPGYANTWSFNIRSGRYVKISVTDTGCGMNHRTRIRIFEPFFSTKEKGTGTGLGLASAYGIIKNHGGFINCYSEMGSGTTFTVYLPVSDKPLNVQEKKSAAPSRDEPLIGSETILFVDDEEEILSVGRKMLESLGYTVQTARNGRDAIECYREHPKTIDAVVLDLVMPDLGGRDVFEQLKRIDPSVKVLLSSGYGTTQQVRELLSMGCNGFIQKPYDTIRMSQVIRRIIDRG